VADGIRPIQEHDAVALAREKYHCPSCGAEASWNPARQALLCAFCGTESPVVLEKRTAETIIVEHDLVEALRNIPDEARGWRAAKTTVRCQSCHAISVFDPDKMASRCAFCGSAQLVPYSEIKEAFRPESLLPLVLSEAQARDAIRAWYKRQWLAPNSLNARALTDTVKAVYLPYWTFDASVSAHWAAESGTYYYSGVGKSRRRRVRWTPVEGDIEHEFDDDLVPASLGVDARRLRAIEPFPTGGLIPYDPGYVAGWTVERYQIDLIAAAARSREQMEAALRRLCAQQIPGDTYRNLEVHSTYRDQRFKHILVPIWLMSYTYGATSYQVVVNGVTGAMSGGRPWSWVKILLLVLLGLVMLALYAATESS
jgi:hypothetical protein